MSFRKIKLINPIIRAVTEAGFSRPTEVQNQVIPFVLEGRDVIAYAPSNSGKKTAIVIPMLQLLKKNAPEHRKIRALIVVPDAECAVLFESLFDICSKYTSVLVGNIVCSTINYRETVYKQSPDILISTSELLTIQHTSRNPDLSRLELIAVYHPLDNKEKYFMNRLGEIIMMMPDSVQKLVLSQEVSDDLAEVVRSLKNNCARIKISEPAKISISVDESVFFVERRDKAEMLIKLYHSDTLQKFMVFVENRYICDQLCQYLNSQGINTSVIHSGRTHSSRDMDLEKFRKGILNVVITTDIASRDFKLIEHANVLHYDLPENAESYAKRLENTKGKSQYGSSFSFCTADQHLILEEIQKDLGYRIPVKTIYN